MNVPNQSNAIENTQITEDVHSISSETLNNQQTHQTGKSAYMDAREASPKSEKSQPSHHSVEKKKDKKLVFLSRSVLQSVRETPMTTGTEIAYEILELYKRFSDKVDFKNVQRRVYDALNVLSAMDII